MGTGNAATSGEAEPPLDLEKSDTSPDILDRLQSRDEEPPVVEDFDAGELMKLAALEMSEQNGALRGPIYLDELARDGKRPAIYYRRPSLTRAQEVATKLEEARGEGKLRPYLNALYLVENALDRNGDRIFGRMQIEQIETGWYEKMVTRIVNAIDRGCATKLTDEQLGKS